MIALSKERYAWKNRSFQFKEDKIFAISHRSIKKVDRFC